MSDHLPNPYVPGDKLNPKPAPRSKTTVIKLWLGGEHTNARKLAGSMKLSAVALAEIAAACPGWND